MKVSFPLSLKVTVWLLLNLLILGAAAAAFLIAQAGLSWDSLVAGSSGDRLHALANVVAGEVAAADPGDRHAILDRFGSAYHADFLIVLNHGPELSGKKAAFPIAVRQRIDEGPGHGPPGRMGPPEMGPANDRDPRPDFGPPGIEPGTAVAGRRPPGPLRRGRFLVHAGDPKQWWIGLRVPFPEPGDIPKPATLVIEAHSFWRVILLLNLETWFLVAAAVLTLSILFWLPLVRSITHHLRALVTATERIADGKFETRVATNRRDELGRLGESVNTMAVRLDMLVNGQKRFLADIAHELGSPIGRLQVATEILETRTPPEFQQQVADVRDEVQHMADLVNELLAFTKAGMRPRETALAPVALDQLFAKVLAREDQQQRVQRHATLSVNVLADEPLLTRAISNLVRNALRYAGAAATISLSARSDGDRVAIAVEDDGPGVPGAALTRLGEPFYRPETARTRETGGVGLGLAIVRSAVAACGGEVRFSNRSPRGFRAEVRLAAAT